jgi:hypothetical protein
MAVIDHKEDTEFYTGRGILLDGEITEVEESIVVERDWPLILHWPIILP